MVGRQMFAPYGEARGGGGMAGVPWGWATHRQGEGPGLVYMRARWYAPGVGRFVSADPIPDGAGTGTGHARYDYGRGNPMRFTDPSGHCIPCVLGFLIGTWVVDQFRGAQATGKFEPIITYATPFVPSITYHQPTPMPSPTAAQPTTAQSTATPTPVPTQAPSPLATATNAPISANGFASPVGGSYQVLCPFGAGCGYGANGHNGGDLVSSNDPGLAVRPNDDNVAGREVYAVGDGHIFAIYEPDVKTWTPVDNPPGITIDAMHGNERWQYTHVYPTEDILAQHQAAVKNGKPVRISVRAGQLLGYYAQIGYSTAPHLHISRWVDGQLVDPISALP